MDSFTRGAFGLLFDSRDTYMSKKADPKPKDKMQGPYLVYGLDKEGKPRGARYLTIRDDFVSTAMDMGLQVLLVPDALAAIVAKLPLGRIYASGKAFIPIIRRPLYDKLKAVHDSLEAAQKIANEKGRAESSRSNRQLIAQADVFLGKKAIGNLPTDWGNISSGDIVVAPISPDEGWWSCIVVEREADLLKLRYRDYPKRPEFTRHISTIARGHPGA